jgi:hypothetical protein
VARKAFDPSFKLINDDGTATQYFSELMQRIVKSLPTRPVSATEPTAGQVLKYNSTTQQYEPG